MLDREGYRPNVGIVLINNRNEVFWAKRRRQHSWQFPQGGIKPGESPQTAMYRELFEETGLKPESVKIIGRTREWLRYNVPEDWNQSQGRRFYKGQKQIWFILKLKGWESQVRLFDSSHPEFDAWRWVDYWYPIDEVIYFKREVYFKALYELSGFLSRMETYPSFLRRTGRDDEEHEALRLEVFGGEVDLEVPPPRRDRRERRPLGKGQEIQEGAGGKSPSAQKSPLASSEPSESSTSKEFVEASDVSVPPRPIPAPSATARGEIDKSVAGTDSVTMAAIVSEIETGAIAGVETAMDASMDFETPIGGAAAKTSTESPSEHAESRLQSSNVQPQKNDAPKGAVWELVVREGAEPYLRDAFTKQIIPNVSLKEAGIIDAKSLAGGSGSLYQIGDGACKRLAATIRGSQGEKFRPGPRSKTVASLKAARSHDESIRRIPANSKDGMAARDGEEMLVVGFPMADSGMRPEPSPFDKASCDESGNEAIDSRKFGKMGVAESVDCAMDGAHASIGWNFTSDGEKFQFSVEEKAGNAPPCEVAKGMAGAKNGKDGKDGTDRTGAKDAKGGAESACGSSESKVSINDVVKDGETSMARDGDPKDGDSTMSARNGPSASFGTLPLPFQTAPMGRMGASRRVRIKRMVFGEGKNHPAPSTDPGASEPKYVLTVVNHEIVILPEGSPMVGKKSILLTADMIERSDLKSKVDMALFESHAKVGMEDPNAAMDSLPSHDGAVGEEAKLATGEVKPRQVGGKSTKIAKGRRKGGKKCGKGRK